MKTEIRIAVLFLSLILMVVPLASCAAHTDQESGTSASEAPVSAAPAATTEYQECPEYPDVYYNGENFTILVSGHPAPNFFNDFKANEASATVIDDAIYKRNAIVEQQFGVKIVTVEDKLETPNAKNLIIKNHTSQDNLYDAAMPIAYDVSVLAYSSYLYDLNSLPTVDLSHSWWDRKANDELSIRGIMYFTTGAFGIWANHVTYCIAFNKNLADSYSVPDLYTLVKNGEWTIDKMAETAKLVSADLNSDGKRDQDDLYGITTWDDAMYGIVNGAGGRCCEINDNGDVVLTIGDDRVYSAIEKYMSIYTQKEYVINFQYTSIKGSAIGKLFGGGQSLMLMLNMGSLSNFRDTTLDYGIIPYPKLSETQEEYASTIAPWHTNFLCVPYMIKDDVKSGTVAEALCYESSKYIKPAYYEKTLIGTIVRDDESADMLDIIFSTRVFDIGYYYQPANINKQLLISIVRKNSSDWASVYDTYKSAANSQLDVINQYFRIATEEWK